MSTTRKIGGVAYRQVGCSKSQRAAQGRAKALRKSGKTARVLKNGNRYCTFAGPPRKRK